MVDAAVMTEIMRSSVDNTGRSKKIEGIASDIGQHFIWTKGSMVAVVHDLDANLAADHWIEHSGPEVAIYHITIQSKEVQHEQNGGFQEHSDFVSSLGSGDFGLHSFFDGFEERSVPRVEGLVVSYFTNAVFLRRTSLGHCQGMVGFPHWCTVSSCSVIYHWASWVRSDKVGQVIYFTVNNNPTITWLIVLDNFSPSEKTRSSRNFFWLFLCVLHTAKVTSYSKND